MIEIKNLKFKYNQDQTSYVLDDVSFHVKPGEWLSIVGHNGSGNPRQHVLLMDYWWLNQVILLWMDKS